MNTLPRDITREPTTATWDLELMQKANRMLRTINPTAHHDSNKVRQIVRALRLEHAAQFGASNITDWRILNDWNDRFAIQVYLEHSIKHRDRTKDVIISPWS